MAAYQVPVYCWKCEQMFEGVGRAECPRCKPPADPVPMVAFWEGRPITELSREELMEALTETGRMYQELLKERYFPRFHRFPFS